MPATGAWSAKRTLTASRPDTSAAVSRAPSVVRRLTAGVHAGGKTVNACARRLPVGDIGRVGDVAGGAGEQGGAEFGRFVPERGAGQQPDRAGRPGAGLPRPPGPRAARPPGGDVRAAAVPASPLPSGRCGVGPPVATRGLPQRVPPSGGSQHAARLDALPASTRFPSRRLARVDRARPSMRRRGSRPGLDPPRRRFRAGAVRGRRSTPSGRRERRTRMCVAPWASGVRNGIDSATPAS